MDYSVGRGCTAGHDRAPGRHSNPYPCQHSTALRSLRCPHRPRAPHPSTEQPLPLPVSQSPTPTPTSTLPRPHQTLPWCLPCHALPRSACQPLFPAHKCHCQKKRSGFHGLHHGGVCRACRVSVPPGPSPSLLINPYQKEFEMLLSLPKSLPRSFHRIQLQRMDLLTHPFSFIPSHP